MIHTNVDRCESDIKTPRICIINSPIIFFEGAGGMIRPYRRYLATKMSCRPRKSLKRRNVLNWVCLNLGMLDLVLTLGGGAVCVKVKHYICNQSCRLT